MPSYSQMVRQYDVTQSTIDRVLQEFTYSGLIVRQPGKGIFVSSKAKDRFYIHLFGNSLLEIGGSDFPKLLHNEFKQYIKERGETFRYYVGVPDVDCNIGQNPSHEQLLLEASDGRIKGLLVGFQTSEDQLKWLRLLGQSIVGYTQWPEPGMVCIDWENLISQAVTTLVSQGCKRIGLVMPLNFAREKESDPDLLTHFCIELKQHGKTYKPEWTSACVLNPEEKDLVTEEAGTFTAERLYAGLDSQDPVRFNEVFAQSPDGIVILEETMARGVATYLQRKGLEIGNHVKIAAYTTKGSPALNAFRNEITSLQVNPRDIVEGLYQQLNSVDLDGRQSQELLVKPKLVSYQTSSVTTV